MKIKSCDVKIKAAGEHEGTPEGVFEAIVATWDLDSVGDRIVKGAFAETLKTWDESGDPIPVYWSHRMDDPDFNIGHVLDAKETDEGLWVKAILDMDSPKAAQVYRLLKGRRVKQFSFAYDVEESAFIDEKEADPYWELRRLRLHEVGPTPIGANQATELLDVKSGRTLSKTNEDRVKDIARLAKELLDSVTSSVESDDEKAKHPAPPAAAAEAEKAKAAPQPAGLSPASIRLSAGLAADTAEVSLTD